jgi:hypothetical protein
LRCHHKPIPRLQLHVRKIEPGSLAKAKAAPGKLRLEKVLHLPCTQPENVARPALRQVELVAAQRPQDQHSHGILPVTRRAHIAVDQHGIGSFDCRLKCEGQRSRAAKELLANLGDQAFIVIAAEGDVARQSQVYDQPVTLTSMHSPPRRRQRRQAWHLSSGFSPQSVQS